MTQEQTQEAELTPEIIEMARRITEKRAKKTAARYEHLLERYPWIKIQTMRFNHKAMKYEVEMDCSECGVPHFRYTSDLFQTKGLCPECRAKAIKAAKKDKKDLLTRAMKLLAEGKIEL
jgi:formylmethanofuran dehydrogenase subunit E